MYLNFRDIVINNKNKISFLISLILLTTSSLFGLLAPKNISDTDALLTAKIFNEYVPARSTTIIEPSAHSELNLIPTESCSMGLSKKIDRTTTIFGKEAFKNKLITPTTNLTEITNIQACVNKFVSDPKLLSRTEKELKTIANSEHAFLDYFYDEFFIKPVENKKIDDLSTQEQIESNFWFANMGYEWLNSPAGLEAGRRFDQFAKISFLVGLGLLWDL